MQQQPSVVELVIRWYTKTVLTVLVSGVIFGGIIPAMISADSWGFVFCGVAFMGVSIPVLAYMLFIIGSEAITIYKNIKQESGK